MTARVRRPAGTEEVTRHAYLVGCDGADSAIRKAAGPDFAGDGYTGGQFVQADCRLASEPPGGSTTCF